MKLRMLPTIFVGLASFAGAQTTTSSPPPSQSQGAKVIFSRSIEDGQTAPETASKPATALAASTATDAERRSITFLSYDLAVHLRPRGQHIAVRARMVLRNDGEVPLRRLPLQLSSSLTWIDVRVEDQPAVFQQAVVDSDSDHTGMLHEAVIALTKPLDPKQSILVDATYEGAIPLSATRLERIGTPQELAEHSDWDRISDDFVGLRGFGNVAWYPVASIPVALGDGNKFFTEIAAQRLRESEATVTMRVTEEFFGPPPNLAVLDGEPATVTPASLPSSASVPGIATCTLPAKRLGFSSPSLFLLTRMERSGSGIAVFTRPENVENAQSYMAAATMVEPMLSRWMGPHPKEALPIVDLSSQGDAPFEDGSVLFTDVESAQPAKLAEVLVHSLTHVYFRSPYPWLQEGVANFMDTLWLEQQHGRDFAILQMDNRRSALSLVEPGPSQILAAGSSSSTSAPSNLGESLLRAKDPIYYRTKATYVFWMLRRLAGDDALAHAFQDYSPSQDQTGREFERVLERTSGKDLKWFFDDWVYRDRGLPDLSIVGIYPNQASIPGSYIVAVDIANSGDAEAQVPVSVHSQATTVTEQLRVPANSRITHRFLVQGKPLDVAVNDGTVPEVEASVHRRSLASQP